MVPTDERRTKGRGDGLRRWLHPGAREVYRDSALWVLEKPAGVLTHPNPPAQRAANALLRATYDPRNELYRLEAPGGGGRRERAVHLVHRLDLETSGLLLCALNAQAAARLKEALYERQVRKVYLALVLGCPRRPTGEWLDRLERRSGAERVDVRARPRGRPNARTRYRLRRRFSRQGLALVELEPRSGRTHQLRVQAARRRHPIAGDERYGDFKANRFLARGAGLRRMFLHAWRLELLHPLAGHRLELQCDLEVGLEKVLDALGALRGPVPRRGG